ncbi:beta-ketoacyl synthase [Aquabacterium sp.]|uniref:beta-ketoacyl-[acyl-carrier-protein] synthase family protein n=1 Tax=Aquabacterium sp. TaxID=1872578 RepID=UPI0035AE9FA3
MRKVLVTGLGMISPLGADKDSSFEGTLAARSAVAPAPAAICAGLPNLLVAQVAGDPAARLDRQFAGHDRATLLALVAAQEAMQQAGLPPRQLPQAERFGAYVGVGFAGANTLDALYGRYFQAVSAGAGSGRAAVVHPLSVPRMMANASAAMLSMHYGLRGVTNTYAVACASSAVAVGEAMRAIAHGYLDAVLVVGAESMLTAGCMVAWNALRVMAKPDADNPAASCKPFSARRSGFVLGEGAAALVLESAEHAQARGARALAEVAGYGCSSDAQHLTAPSVDGQVAAMRQALAQAGLQPADIHYLNAHGTATDAGDVIETQSIHAVFGEHAARLPVSSTKAVHGHLIGAGGAAELVISILAMNRGAIPPTANLTDPDPRCDLDYVPLQARRGCDIQAVMSNSFAFGGSNACLVARRVAAP